MNPNPFLIGGSMKPFLPLMTLASTLFAGCGEEPKYCTEIGCSDIVVFTILDSYGGPATGASGTITIGETDYEFDCSDASASQHYCEDGVLTIVIDGGTTATYSVSWGDESVQDDVELEFETFQPNGEGCDPICLTAAHTIELFRSFEE
jgi:hypothetical protein